MSLVKVKNLSYTATGISAPLLKDISFELAAGETMMLLGANGSGKSTLIDALFGRATTYEGEIEVCGQNLRLIQRSNLIKNLRLLGQDPSLATFPDLTVRENLELAQEIYKPTPGLDLLAHLESIRPGLSQHQNKPARALSGGERQALALALVLLAPPKILLLDEHTSALDKKSAAHIMQRTVTLAQDLGISLVVATHQLDDAREFGDRILIMNQGKIRQTLLGSEFRKMDQQTLINLCYG